MPCANTIRKQKKQNTGFLEKRFLSDIKQQHLIQKQKEIAVMKARIEVLEDEIKCYQ